MKLDDLVLPETDVPLLENSRRSFKVKGNKIVHAFTCMSGPRRGRKVSNPSQCFKPIDLKKRMQFKRTKARLGKRMALKRKRTMRVNPMHKRVARLNKSLKRK